MDEKKCEFTMKFCTTILKDDTEKTEAKGTGWSTGNFSCISGFIFFNHWDGKKEEQSTQKHHGTSVFRCVQGSTRQIDSEQGFRPVDLIRSRPA